MKEAREACIHYWIIDAPSGGPTSKGTCKLCGSERDHYNAPESMRELGSYWFRENVGSWAYKQAMKEADKQAKTND
tara:strand:- start:2274 stop:2501 length:228 start_codon:yes stop_codon:yes gene_type:complete